MTALLTLMLSLLASGGASAHSLGESYAVLREGPDARTYTVTYNMRRDQFLQLADLRFYSTQPPLDIVATVVGEHYRLFAAGEPCTKSRSAVLETEAFLQASFVARCPPSGSLDLHNDAFFDLLPDHLHFVRVSGADGNFVAERVMDRTHRRWAIPEAPSAASVLEVSTRYARLGLEHMAFGFDHLAFLASILLLVRGMRPLIYAVTGFTVGHSVTLALSVLGFAIPDGQLVEALIGLTIALVAAESVFRRQARLQAYARIVLVGGALLLLPGALGLGPDPLTMAGVALFFAAYLRLTSRRPEALPILTPLLTAFFGLIHGFGFAGSLLEIGLPTERLAVALVVFNLGIEAGQLLIVAALLAGLAALARWIPAVNSVEGMARTGLSGALVSVGTFWFVQRAFA